MGSRKRPRTCEDEACELMPISKRINDLHIRSGNLSDVNSHHSEHVPHIQSQPIMYNGMNSGEQAAPTANLNGHMTPASHPPVTVDYEVCHYSPELSAVQNPYYYHINEVLFQAHLNRLQRLSK